MQVGDLIRTIYSDRTAIVTEVNPLPTWNTSPFGVKFTMLDGKPISKYSGGSPDGMQPSDRIRIVSTSATMPVQFVKGEDGWWRGGLWGETYAQNR